MDLMIKLAESLEAAADLIDEQASRIAEVDSAERTEKLAALRGRLEPLLNPDTEITDEVLEKFAGDESLSRLLDGLYSGEGLVAHASSSLGSAVPAGNEKTGSVRDPGEKTPPAREKIAEQVDEAGRALLEFCRSGA